MSFVTFAYWQRTARKIITGLYLLFLYTGSVIASFFLDSSLKNFSFLATFYFFLILFMFLLPVLLVKTNKTIEFGSPRINVFNLYSYIFIVLGLVSIAYYIPIVATILSSPLSFLSLRGSMVAGQKFYSVTPIFYITVLHGQFFPIVLLFFFYSITFLKKTRKFNFALLIASTSYIWSVFAAIGRDGFVLWTMSFFFCYALFYYQMGTRLKKAINRWILICSVPFSTIFMLMTLSRFAVASEGKYEGPMHSIIYYFGMQFLNFNTIFNVVDSYKFHSYLDIFPILRYIASSDYSYQMTNIESANTYISIYGIDVYTFATFIGHAWLSLNTFSLLFLALVFCFVFSYIFYKIRRKKKMPFNMLILYTFIAQIPLHGVFYYKLGHVVSNIYMINILIMVFLFSRRLRRNSMFENKTELNSGNSIA